MKKLIERTRVIRNKLLRRLKIFDENLYRKIENEIYKKNFYQTIENVDLNIIDDVKY